MADDPVQQLNDRLIQSSSLLEEFRKDPVDCVQRHGIELTPQQQTNLRGAKLHEQDDAALKATLTAKPLAAHF
jgi:hypothetical protein